MNVIAKIGLYVGAALSAVVGLGIGYLYAAFPKVSETSRLELLSDSELVTRGSYLAESVMGCLDCHSRRDWARFSAPPLPETRGAGGQAFPAELGFPGTFYSKNITPYGIGRWTNGEVARAITEGVTRDGRAMFPVMPYPYYRHVCDRDLKAVISFVRTLVPIQNDVPASKLDFPMNLIVRTIPQPREPWPCPADGSPDQGKYLTTIAGCKECHTQNEHGTPLLDMDFAGGWEFPRPSGGRVSSANITPDPETGIGNWTKEQFVARFTAMRDERAAVPVAPGSFNTVMPWTLYATMTERDLEAIYDHLRTVRPVSYRVERFRAN